jgi:hypothetical protein
VKIVKKERDHPLFTSKQLSYDIRFVYRRTDGETDMVKPVYPPYNFVEGGIIRDSGRK